MKRLPVLYLCPENMSPQTVGGRWCYAELFRLLAAEPWIDLKVIMVDVDGQDPASLDPRIALFPRVRLPKGIRALGYAIAHTLSGHPPHAVRARQNPKAREQVGQWLTEHDVILVDHYMGMGLLPDGWQGWPGRGQVWYRSLDQLATFFREAAACFPVWHPRHWWMRWEGKKAARFEAACFRDADRVLSISASDIRDFRRLYPATEVAFVPPMIGDPGQTWGDTGSRSLLFVGGLSYPPNRMAIGWLCREVAPRLAGIDPKLEILLAGTKPDALPPEWRHPAVRPLGFVPDDELDRLYRTCQAFLCPIDHGTGIKTKLLKALENGTPVLATLHSWEGTGEADPAQTIHLSDMAQVMGQLRAIQDPETRQRHHAHNLQRAGELRGQAARLLQDLRQLCNAGGTTEQEAAAP